MPISFPVPEPRLMGRYGLLSTRQEAFCRHFVACGNAAEAPQLMLRVVRFQAELSGLSREGQGHRPDYWPVPDEDEFGEVAAAAGMTAPGPLAQAVRLGGERAERALARHEAQAAGPDGPGEKAVNGAANGEAERLRAEIEDCRRLLDPPAPAPDSDRVFPPTDRDLPFRPKPGFGEHPDIRKGDDEYIDGVESDWMNRLRNGDEPVEPWPDAPTHEDPFASAQDDPAQDEPEQDDPEQDDPERDDPERDGEAEDGPSAPLAGPEDSAPCRHPANGLDPTNGVDSTNGVDWADDAPLPQAARMKNGSAAGQDGAAPDIS